MIHSSESNGTATLGSGACREKGSGITAQFHVLAGVLRGATWECEFYVVDVDVCAATIWRAGQTGNGSFGARASDILEPDVLDEGVGRELRADGRGRHVALIDDNGVVDGRLEEVLECDVLDNTASDVWACPCFDPGAVLGTRHLDILGEHILNDVKYAGELTERANRDTVGSSTIEVLNQNVGRVGLECDAVITVDDDRVQYLHIVATIHIPSVSVRSTMGGVGDRMDIDVVVDDIFALIDKVVPLRAVYHMYVVDGHVLSLEYGERDWPQEGRIACECVPPCLS